MKELAEQILELTKYLDKNPWDAIKRTERYELVDRLCNMVINGK
jgi:hypothetical protein